MMNIILFSIGFVIGGLSVGSLFLDRSVDLDE